MRFEHEGKNTLYRKLTNRIPLKIETSGLWVSFKVIFIYIFIHLFIYFLIKVHHQLRRNYD